MRHLPVLATRNDMALVGHQGTQWVDGETVGRKLGYGDPMRAISKLYKRHQDEFKSDETSVVKLTTEVGRSGRSKRGHLQTVEVRLFSVPRGVFRLCMLSNAPNRVEVHDQILDLYDTFRFGGWLRHLPSDQPAHLSAWQAKEMERRFGAYTGKRIVKDLLNGCFDAQARLIPMDELAALPDGSTKAAAVSAYAAARKVSRQTGYVHLARHREAFGIEKPVTRKTGKPRRTRADKGAWRNSPEYRAVEFVHCQMPNLPYKEIARATGVPAARVSRWLRVAV